MFIIKLLAKAVFWYSHLNIVKLLIKQDVKQKAKWVENGEKAKKVKEAK